jgi:Tfp pilus assembly protein FimT
MPLKKQTGFTLVEVLIVIGVIMTLLLVGVPLTTAWIDSSQVNQASATLKSAGAQAKAAALRNTQNKTTGTATASLCFNANNRTLSVVLGTCSSTTVLRNYALAKGVNIKVGNNNFSCITFDSVGLVITQPNCVTDTVNFKVKKNNEENSVDIS